MLDVLHLPDSTHADVQVFNANSTVAGNSWATWVKRRGVSMCQILVWGAGGGGGNGVVGANSTAAGGGGGGSGGQTSLLIPAFLLPDFLFVAVSVGGSVSLGSSVASRVAIAPETVNVNATIAIANGGGNGGNGAGATAGAAGAAGVIATIGTMPLGGMGQLQLFQGQAGIIGGTTVAGAALTLPVTGLLVTGGTGGGGLPAAATVGTNGGAFTVNVIHLPSQSGGLGATAATTPGGNGSNGISGIRGLAYDYGGSGGGSSHGSATGAGLVGGKGGKGAIGCGGGGGGGALTGSTQGTGGFGGDGQVIIISW